MKYVCSFVASPSASPAELKGMRPVLGLRALRRPLHSADHCPLKAVLTEHRMYIFLPAQQAVVIFNVSLIHKQKITTSQCTLHFSFVPFIFILSETNVLMFSVQTSYYHSFLVLKSMTITHRQKLKTSLSENERLEFAEKRTSSAPPNVMSSELTLCNLPGNFFWSRLAN